jgi:diguanylate cyclase (GGDEF)-like protein
MPANATMSRSLTSKLRRLFAEAKMPTDPALAASILKLIRDPKSSVADFAAVIRSDPALAARLLKTANSVHFAQRTPVTTVGRAITVLGLNRVRMISLAFQLVAHLDRLGGTPFDMKTFWQHSLLRACLARSIAQKVAPERQEEAFLIGLLLECGILLLVQVHGSAYGNLYRSTKLSPTAFYAVESRSFPETHVEAISVMASEWRLPQIIAVPLGQHHTRVQLDQESTETDRLSAVSYFVGSLRFADGLTIDPEEEDLREFGRATLELEEATWAEVRDGAADEYQRVSHLYADIVPEDVDVAELLGEANRQLASVAHDASQRMLDVAAERAAIRREQRGLENALREYRERAALDPLTNVCNRGALTEAARKAIEEHIDNGTSVGALFLDLDNFKQLNDTCGHEVGDNVLKAVAALLVREVSRMGVVGRYGGEEFVIVLRGLSADVTRQIAAQIVTSVRELDGQALGCPGPVTCSLGAVWGDRLSVSSAEELFAAADQLMYKAKRRGKDRYLFGLLPEPHGPVRDSDGAEPSTTEPGTTEPGRPSQETRNDQDNAGGLEQMLAIARQLNDNEVDTFAGIRKQERKKLIVPCAMHYFTGDGAETRDEQAATRNISTGGTGLLVRRPLARGEAVEVVLDRGASRLFLAGLISFCRHIVGGIHEVGVQFVTYSVTPIICADAPKAVQKLDWVARAVRAKQDHKLEPRVHL